MLQEVMVELAKHITREIHKLYPETKDWVITFVKGD